MLTLTVKNVRDYIASKKMELSFAFSSIKTVEEVTEETYVNWIFRVVFETDEGEKTGYLRQSRDFVKKKPDIQLPAERITFENKILRFIHTLTTDVVPEVLFFDKPNNVLWLSDIKRGCPLLVSELQAGRVPVNAAPYFGSILAHIHGKTLGISHEQVRGNVHANKAAVDFHLGMRLKSAQEMFPQETESLLRMSSSAQSCLVMGDLASKNIFIDNGKIRFLDLERSFVGDPAFDVAFLFCHLLIEVSIKNRKEALIFVEKFMKSYKKVLHEYLSGKKIKSLENRMTRFLGITILYRLHGFYLAVAVKGQEEYWNRVAQSLLGESVQKEFCDSLKFFLSL